MQNKIVLQNSHLQRAAQVSNRFPRRILQRVWKKKCWPNLFKRTLIRFHRINLVWIIFLFSVWSWAPKISWVLPKTIFANNKEHKKTEFFSLSLVKQKKNSQAQKKKKWKKDWNPDQHCYLVWTSLVGCNRWFMSTVNSMGYGVRHAVYDGRKTLQ